MAKALLIKPKPMFKLNSCRKFSESFFTRNFAVAGRLIGPARPMSECDLNFKLPIGKA